VPSQLYAYFKQAKQDPPFESATKPSVYQFKVCSRTTSSCATLPIEANQLTMNPWQAGYKYKAWEKIVNEGVTPANAEKEYISFVEELKQKHGYDPNKQPEAVSS